MRTRTVPLLLLAAACTAPRESSTSARPEPTGAPPEQELEAQREARMLDVYDPLAPPPWTTAFEDRTILMAEHVRVEGPPGLITHCVVQQDPERFHFETKTTPEGLLQRTTRLPDDWRDFGIRVQLDGMQIMVMGSIEVLERPNPVDVSIVARGEAWWRDPATAEERRGDELRFRGGLEAEQPAPGT